MEENAEEDLNILKKHLEAKRALLLSVFKSANEVKSQRRTIVEELHIEPSTSGTATDVTVEDVNYSFGIGDQRCYGWRMRSKSSKRIFVSAHTLCPSTVQLQLFNSEQMSVGSIAPFSEVECVVCLPEECFLSRALPELVFDFESKENELIPGESSGTLVVKVPEVTVYHNLNDLQAVSSGDVERILRALSVCWYSCAIPDLSALSIEQKFPGFEVADFGTFQVVIGSCRWNGIVMQSSIERPSRLNKLIARSRQTVELFLILLKETFPEEFATNR